MKATHTTTHPASCAKCLTDAEKAKMPWHKDALDVIARSGKFAVTHAQAMRRKGERC